jgi:uncharacterized membrane protein
LTEVSQDGIYGSTNQTHLQYTADLGQDVRVIADTNRRVVLADWHYSHLWFWLGVTTFISMAGILYLMTVKPSFG